MTPEIVIQNLRSIGYFIRVDGEEILLTSDHDPQDPDLAMNLLTELKRCKAEAVNILKTGNTFTPSEIVEQGATVGTIWQNPYPQGTPEARQESLQQVMTAIWATTFDRVAAIWPRGFMSTPEIRTAEIEIKRVQALVISGKGKIADFLVAVEAWELMVKQGVTI